MNWNHRIVRYMYGDKEMFLLAEVFYNDSDGSPAGYTEPFMCSESVDGLKTLVAFLQDALQFPVINEEDMIDKREPDEDEDDNEKSRSDVIRELAESMGISVRDVPMPNYNAAPGECPLCGNPDKCDECK